MEVLHSETVETVEGVWLDKKVQQGRMAIIDLLGATPAMATRVPRQKLLRQFASWCVSFHLNLLLALPLFALPSAVSLPHHLIYLSPPSHLLLLLLYGQRRLNGLASASPCIFNGHAPSPCRGPLPALNYASPMSVRKETCAKPSEGFWQRWRNKKSPDKRGGVFAATAARDGRHARALP